MNSTTSLCSSALNSRVNALELSCDGVVLLDQTVLPNQVRYITVQTVPQMVEAIQTMIVRGAPAIGIAGAFGVVLSARQHLHSQSSLSALINLIEQDIDSLRQSRPTAVNLGWALDQMLLSLKTVTTLEDLLPCLTQKAQALYEEDVSANKAMGAFGAELVPKGARILTHCNAGALATAGYGTALGVIRAAFAHDPTLHVYADETRPRFQGARLTTWELQQEGIPVTLIADNMAGSLMQAGKIDFVVVGADRIAANGDTANKIGTYPLAVLAHAHNVPFYVAAPISTFDLTLESGAGIPIEERDAEEVSCIHDEWICPEGIGFYNPAFDVTPARYITGIITEKGIARPDYQVSLAQLKGIR